MSISNPQVKNPATKFIEFKSGQFQYWDKEAGKSIPVPLPIEFIVIDELATVKGWSDKNQCGIYSNEVHSTQTEELNVKFFKGGNLTKGIYQDIKGTLVAEGGRYSKSVYALMNGELVNFQFLGASLSAWIEKDAVYTKPIFSVKETKEGKKGATTYKIPVFESDQADGAEYKAAIKVDVEVLQPYLNSRKVAVDEVPLKDDEVKTLTVNDLKNAGTPEAKAQVAESVDEEVKIDDLPF